MDTEISTAIQVVFLNYDLEATQTQIGDSV